MDNLHISKGIHKLKEHEIKYFDLGVTEIPYICLMVENVGYKIFINTKQMQYSEVGECLYKIKPVWNLIGIYEKSKITENPKYSICINGTEEFETPERLRFTLNSNEIFQGLKTITGIELERQIKNIRTPEQEQQDNREFIEKAKNGTHEKDYSITDSLGSSFLNNALMSLSKAINEKTTRETIKQLTPDEKKVIAPTIKDLEQEQIEGIRNKIIPNLRTGKAPTQTRKELATYLELKYGVILRKNTGEIYMLDKTGYTFIGLDDIITLLGEDFGRNVVSNKDIKEALESITTRLEPVYNIVKFPNCVFDIEKGEIIEPEEPIFTLIEAKYNYNPNAKSTIFKSFLYSSLARETPKKTENTVKGLFQLSGYLFTSGNKYNFAPILSGVSGGGKSIFIELLTEIFGENRVSDLSLQEMEKNTHGTSSLANKHLNFIKDSGNTTIEDSGTYKKITGNEGVQINPKYRPPYMLPSEEVPKTVLTCNKIPKFKDYSGIIDRLVIIEFLVKFRNTEKENPFLKEEIIAEPEELEWFIYNSIKEYCEIENKQDFILKLPNEETIKLIEKHTHPINYLLGLVIEEHNPERYKEEKKPPIIAKDLNKVLKHLGFIHGVELDLNKNNEIPPKKLLNAIKKEFDLYDGETILDESKGYITRDYKTRQEYIFNNKTRKFDYMRCYPNLIAKTEYTEILDKLEAKEN